MSTRAKTYLPTLKRIRRLGEKARRDYVRKCDNEFIHCVSDCAKKCYKRKCSAHNSSDEKPPLQTQPPQSSVHEKDVAAKKTKDSAERWLSERAATSGSVGLG